MMLATIVGAPMPRRFFGVLLALVVFACVVTADTQVID